VEDKRTGQIKAARRKFNGFIHPTQPTHKACVKFVETK
jgi:hypothetical protein